MEEDRTTFETLEAAFIEGRLSRRELLRRSALIGAGAAAAHLLGSLGLARPAHAQDRPRRAAPSSSPRRASSTSSTRTARAAG